MMWLSLWLAKELCTQYKSNQMSSGYETHALTSTVRTYEVEYLEVLVCLTNIPVACYSERKIKLIWIFFQIRFGAYCCSSASRREP